MGTYNPLSFVQKDKFGIGQASQIAGGAIAAAPEQFRQKELREEAVKNAGKDWRAMEKSWQAIKNQYMTKAEMLKEKGLMTQEEIESDIAMLRMPTETDKKDPGKYIDSLGRVYGSLVDKVNKKSRQSQLTSAVSTASQDRMSPQELGQSQQVTPVGPGGESFTETDITARPQQRSAATTKSQFTQAPEVQELAPTSDELGQVPQFAQAADAPKPEQQMTPYQQWRVKHTEKKDAANAQMKRVALRLKKSQSEQKTGQQDLDFAMKSKEKFYTPLLKDAADDKDELQAQLKSDSAAGMPTMMKEQIKLEIKERERLIKEYSRIISSSSPDDILKFLTPGTYEFSSGLPKKTGGSGSQIGGNQQGDAQKAQAQALLKQLESMPNKTAQVQQDIRDLKAFLGT